MVVDQFVAGRAEDHEIVHVVDFLWTFPSAASRTVGSKRDNVGDLGEIPFLERHVVFKKILIATVKFTAPTGPYKKDETIQRRNTPRRLDGGCICSLTRVRWFADAHVVS